MEWLELDRGGEMIGARIALMGGSALSALLINDALAADVPFTTYAFPVTGASADRTLPDRLTCEKNVKDFGAIGNGVHDDWAAIQAAVNWTISNSRGTVYWPPGTYLVSQSIDANGENVIQRFIGYGATITGNFADFIIKRASLAGGGAATFHIIEGLTIINTHANGGGIRWGDCVGGAIRNCVVTANAAINTNDLNIPHLTSFEISIENCVLSPGSVPTNSIGLESIANGLVSNCQFIGFQTGLRFFGNEGYMAVMGCYFERNLVGLLIEAISLVTGCRFKDNGTAMKPGVGRYCGIHIEASESVTVFGARPQYGIQIAAGHIYETLLTGISVTGEYDQYAIYIEGGEGAPLYSEFVGVHASNASSHGGLPWHMPASAAAARFIECNIAATPAVFTMARLPVIIGGVTAATWAAKVIWGVGTVIQGSGYVDGTYFNVPLTGGSGTGAVAGRIDVVGGKVLLIDEQFYSFNILFYPPSGTNYVVGDVLSASNANLGGSGSGFSAVVSDVRDTATATISGANLNPFNSVSVTLNVDVLGVTPTQYNGAYTGCFALSTNTLAYAPVANPGGALTVAGTIFINPVFNNIPNVMEGDCFDISDSSSATWGATPVAGGSTHAKIRWGNGGANWTVVGK